LKDARLSEPRGTRAGRFVALVAILVASATRSSEAADPATQECIAASERALSLASDHMLRGQRAQLLVCAAERCPAEVRTDCAKHLEEVRAEIPTIIFEVKGPGGTDVTAVMITMDDQPLADHLEGVALEVDPGQHSFRFEAPGLAPTTKSLLIQQAQKDRHETVTLGPSAAQPPSPTRTVTTPKPADSAAPPSKLSAEGHGLGGQRITALAVGGLGVVGLGVGAVFGFMAMSKKNDATAVCPGPGVQCATQDGVDKWNDAAVFGNVSTVSLIAGGAVLAGGLVLWMTAPDKTSGSPGAQVGLVPGGLRIAGTW
jgi:hypothetical protein